MPQQDNLTPIRRDEYGPDVALPATKPDLVAALDMIKPGHERTIEALRYALEDPDLAPPGNRDAEGCLYVNPYTGKRCIVGTVFHIFGVEDKTLKGLNHTEFSLAAEREVFVLPNTEKICQRFDLADYAYGYGLDCHTLQYAQAAWDAFDVETWGDQNSVEESIIKSTTPQPVKAYLDQLVENHSQLAPYYTASDNEEL